MHIPTQIIALFFGLWHYISLYSYKIWMSSFAGKDVVFPWHPMCSLLDRCICKVYFNVFSFSYLQAKLEEDLPHEVVSKIHLVDLAGRWEQFH